MSLRESLLLIDDCAAIAVPDDEELLAWVEQYARCHRYRLAEDLELIREVARPRARVLEFGSIPLFLSLALSRTECDFHGLDLHPGRFAGVIRDHKLDIREVDFETDPVPFEDETFDLVLFNEVFEHMRINLIATLREVRRVLKPGGTLLLSTPNARSLRGLWMMARHHSGCHVGPDLYEEYDKLRVYGHMGHVREYTAREVSRFLSRIGFRTERTVFRGYGPPVRRALHVRACGASERAICWVFPGLRPMFSLICRKTNNL